MSCPTADKWLVDNAEYDLASEDYVIAGQNSRVVESAFFDRDENIALKMHTWGDFLRFSHVWFVDGARGEGQLIYSDTNQNDPKHKKSVQDIETVKPLLKKVEKHTEEAKQILFSYIRQWAAERERYAYATYDDDDDCMTEGDEDKTGKNSDHTKQELDDDECLKLAYRYAAFGHLPDAIIKFILELETPALRGEVLRILSHQMLTRKPRPIMILIGVLESLGTKQGSGRSGWAIAYDVINNKILIKSIHIHAGAHPLADPWYNNSPNDAFYRAESPETFVANMMPSKKPELPGDDENYRLALNFLTGRWLDLHSLPLKLSIETAVSLDEAMAAIISRLNKAELPEIAEPVMVNSAREECIELRCSLIKSQDTLRDAAVQAMEEGNETSAVNLAKFFEKSLKYLTQMIEHPDMPLEN